MPPPVFLDPATLDLDHPVVTREQIQAYNPQRHEFALLDAVVLIDEARQLFAGYHDVRPDAWWTRGHIPGRPLFPGVLMIEVAAQLASFLTHHLLKLEGFIGFAGVDQVKFRGVVEPPARFVVVARGHKIRPRRVVCDVQGFVGSTMVFEGRIAGMPV